MKVFQISVIFVLLFGFNFVANAQVDCYFSFRLYVLDEKGRILNDAKVKIRGRDVIYNNETTAYSISILGGCNEKYGVALKVNAKGFEEFEKVIEVNSGVTAYELKLKSKGSKISPQLEQLAVLEGVVKDQNKAVIQNTRVFLTDEKGNRIEKITNENGYFGFVVKSGKYLLEFIGTAGFQSKKYESFNLAKGFKYLDVVLEVRPCDDCELMIKGIPVKKNNK